MILLTTLGIIVSLLAVGYVSFQVYFSRKNSQARDRFLARGIKYVQSPSMFEMTRLKRNFVFEQFDQVTEHGPVFGTRLLGMNTFIVNSPEIAQLVLSKEFTSFTNRRSFNIKDPIFSSFLSTAEDEKWKRIRSIVTPTFSTGKLKRMKPRIDDSLRTLMNNLEKATAKSKIVDVKEMSGAYTMDTILQVAFGTKVDSLVEKDNQIVAMAKQMFSTDLKLKQVIVMFMFFVVPGLAKLLGIRNPVTDFFKDFSMKIINQKREELKKEENIGKANNFLELLLEAEAENAKLQAQETEGGASGKVTKFMNNDEMIAQCILFFIAAYDTTSTAISLSAYLLALNPEIQERLYHEICDQLKKLKSQCEDPEAGSDPLKLVTFESLSQFEYLNSVVAETLRLYPPASVERTASRDMRLEAEDGSLSINLQKGDIVQFPVYAMHRDPNQFPDPDKFNPERFLGSQPTFHKYSYLPFGSGPRNCVARSLALFESKMAIMGMVYRYKLSPCEQTKIPVEFFTSQILTPKDITLSMERR